MPLVEQEMLTLPEHLRSGTFFSTIKWTGIFFNLNNLVISQGVVAIMYSRTYAIVGIPETCPGTKLDIYLSLVCLLTDATSGTGNAHTSGTPEVWHVF
jgi:hypothetical protein